MVRSSNLDGYPFDSAIPNYRLLPVEHRRSNLFDEPKPISLARQVLLSRAETADSKPLKTTGQCRPVADDLT